MITLVRAVVTILPHYLTNLAKSSLQMVRGLRCPSRTTNNLAKTGVKSQGSSTVWIGYWMSLRCAGGLAAEGAGEPRPSHFRHRHRHKQREGQTENTHETQGRGYKRNTGSWQGDTANPDTE